MHEKLKSGGMRVNAQLVVSTTKWRREPTLRELLLLVAVGGVFFAATLIAFHGWHGRILRYGDNGAYLGVASEIRHWDFHGSDIQHFMGYPYAIVVVSPASAALFTICDSRASFCVLCALTLVAERSAGALVSQCPCPNPGSLFYDRD
jgi:hypothetical protein